MMVNTKFLQIIAKLIAFLCLLMHVHVLCDGGFNTQFIASEAEALLEFKDGLKDPSNLLSSWTLGKDCCHWKGVGCNTTTGHVISLNLHSSNSLDKLQGELSSSLLQLPYLSYLNLGGNDFMQSRVPLFLGTMESLKHLDLSHANFKGSLFDNLEKLSLLESLDLSGNDFYVNSLKWLHGLSSLKVLDLSGVDLSSCKNDWFHDISIILHSLETLRLSGCRPHKLPKSPQPELNCDSLVTLDLSKNYFNSTIPDWLFENCYHLEYLNLSTNNLQGPIPYSIERLKTLATLDLSHNRLTGSISSILGQVNGQNSLKVLRLSNNQLNGSLETSLHQLSKLVVLDLAKNNLEGNISDVHLANFSNLKVLDLSFNHQVTFNMSKNWIPPFQLETIGLANCHLGPQFPKWIQTQKNFSHIDISNASVSATVPNWFWDLSTNIDYMNLSYNELKRCGHDFSQNLKLKTLDLSHNNFSCPLPHLPPNSKTLDLSNNLFYGEISQVCEVLGVHNSLQTLDVSFNNLSGVIPNCWTNGTNMIILNLAKNNFIGSIPDSFGSLTNLRMLLMYKNGLSGKIPETLKNCQVMTLLDLQLNRFRGTIPSWIGTDMQILESLILSRNSFDGNIPTTLCLLKSLRILDLSQNKLTGAVPRCVFPAMATQESVKESLSHSIIHQSKTKYSLLLTWKGVDWYFTGRLVRLIRLIDLSSNYLTEGIPVEMAKLVELHSLNLSRNQLVGSIPSNIGEMKNLESLDLSRNQLSSVIPTSMVNLSFLVMLNLSYNTLSGKIPIGTLFQSLYGSSFEGNPHLCGVPLDNACPINSSFKDAHCSHSEEHEDDSNHEDKGMGMEINPFYISMGIGFYTGFWVFWGSLIFVASWRHAYFRFLSNMNDRIYVTVVVAYNKLRRKLQAQQPPM